MTSVSIVQNAYNERLKAKSEGKTGLSTVWKLLLNSMYGKSILRAGEELIKYKQFDNENEVVNYMLRKKTKQCVLLSNSQTKIVTRHFDWLHKNMNYWGSIILGMSKRIMNEVINLPCEPLVLNSDTDSLHVLKKYVPIMEREYREIYGKELLGNGLGQFHSDFDNDNALYAVEETFISPKCYCMLVLLRDGTYEEQYRFKGISLKAIEETCKTKGMRVMDWYNQNSIVKINLCIHRNRLKINKDNIKTVKNFERSANLVMKNYH